MCRNLYNVPHRQPSSQIFQLYFNAAVEHILEHVPIYIPGTIPYFFAIHKRTAGLVIYDTIIPRSIGLVYVQNTSQQQE